MARKKKPAYAGLRRLPSVAPTEAGFFGQKPASFGQKKPASGRKGAGFRRLSRLPVSVGRHGKEPAQAGGSRLLSGQEKSRLTQAKAGSFLARKEPAFAGFAGSFPVAPKGMSPARVRHLLAPTSGATRLLNDVIFGHPFDAPGGKCGKHSYSAQRKGRKRRKPLSSGFSWVRKAGFCRLCLSRPVTRETGPYYLRWEPDPAEDARRASEGGFLTSKEGS